MWGNIKEIIGTVAPIAGSLLGGPIGGTVGSMVAGLLGVEDNPKSIENELKKNPDALLKLKTLDSDERIKSLNAMYQDRADARTMNIKVQASKDFLVRNTGSMVAIFTVVSAFIMDMYLLYLSVTNNEINSIFTLIAGGTSVKAVQVLSFYFGDAKSSVDKARG